MNQPASLPPAEARRAAELLAEDPRVTLVYLFGSTLDPGRSAVRDVDVAVLTDPPLLLDALMRRRADLVAATGAPIDLVPLNDAPVTLCHEVVEGGSACTRAPRTSRRSSSRARAVLGFQALSRRAVAARRRADRGAPAWEEHRLPNRLASTPNLRHPIRAEA